MGGAGVVHFQVGCGPEGKPWRIVDPLRKSRDGLALTKAWSSLSCDCVCSNGIEWSTCPLLSAYIRLLISQWGAGRI